MNFRDILPTVLQLLGDNITALPGNLTRDSIKAGSYATLPKAAPFISVYAEPGAEIVALFSDAAIHSASVLIFAGVKPETRPETAVAAATELLEAIFWLLRDSDLTIRFDNPAISFDQAYGLYTVCKLGFSVDYQVVRNTTL